ncbi:MAG: DUF456 domain-containing protein [Gemmatimonadaceae bacterium]|nr:DUF456 domain-containing protein [Gemmatimonadaceae bacterium]
MATLLLALACLAGLAMIAVGLPGTWLMIGAALVYDWLVPGTTFGLWTLGGTLVLALVAEVLEFTVAKRYTERTGGSSRAGWGAMLGGLAGAFAGVPVPIIGSVLGAFAGAFAGALLMEWTVRRDDAAGVVRVATGALVGRAVATASKLGAGVAIGAWLVIVAAGSG